MKLDVTELSHRPTNKNKVRATHNGLTYVHDCRMVMGHRDTARGLKEITTQGKSPS